MENEKLDESFFDKIPDEIFQEILKRVSPSSTKNCFLVSKKFKQQAMYVTRDTWKVRIDDKTLESGDALLNTERLFDKVDWNSFSYNEFSSLFITAEKFFMKFGHRVKKFSMFESQMPEKELHIILNNMPNLVALHLDCYRMNNYANNYYMTSIKSLEFKKMEQIHLVDSTWSFIEQPSCPSLTRFSYEDEDNDIDDRPLHHFIRHHTKINNISLSFGLEDPFIHSHFNVDHLTLEVFVFACGIQEIPFTLLSKQHALEILDIREPIFEETLCQIIVNCPKLTFLHFQIGDEPITQETVKQLLEMECLKSLHCSNVSKEFVESLAKFGSQKMDDLGLWSTRTPIPKNVAVYLGKQFPNVRKFGVDLSNNGREIATAQEMKNLRELTLGFETNVVNFPMDLRLPTVRVLHVFTEKISRNQLFPMVNITPNIVKLRVETDRRLVTKFMSFPKLIQLECSIKSLIKYSTVKVILQRKPKLQTIIAIDVKACATEDIDELFEAYREEFPNIKTNFGERFITLSRD